MARDELGIPVAGAGTRYHITHDAGGSPTYRWTPSHTEKFTMKSAFTLLDNLAARRCSIVGQLEPYSPLQHALPVVGMEIHLSARNSNSLAVAKSGSLSALRSTVDIVHS